MEAFLTASDVIRVPMSFEVFERACRIRAVHKFTLADSLHLAAAIESCCGLFLNNELRLTNFSDIPIEVLS